MAYIDDVYLVVNIAPVGIPTYVRLGQNENGRRLYFAVTGGEIPSGSTATMSGTKPDGVVYSKAGTISGNTVTFNEDIQLTAMAGEWPAKIVIVNGGQTVMTARILFVIDADTVAAGAVPSDSQLEGLVAQAAAYAEAAKDGAFYGSPLVASTVAGMTDKTRVYVYTGSESGYTSGNWYYWNGSAWTSGGVYNATAVSTDTTLSIAGKAADAKATGDAIAAVTIPTDKTLTVSDAPADAKVVGDEIADLKDDITKNNSYDILKDVGTFKNGTSGGVTYTWNADKTACTAVGTTTATSVKSLYNAQTLPSGMVNGETYIVKVSTTNPNLLLEINAYNGSTSILDLFITENIIYTVPAEATRLLIRLRTRHTSSSPSTVNDTISVQILNAKTNKELGSELEEKTFAINYKLGLPVRQYMQIFPKYTTIGDSLMGGFMNRNGVSVNTATARDAGNNWVNYIAIRIGRIFTNLAVGGSTAKDWRNTHLSSANIDTDCYLIGIGVNDHRNALTIGSASDIKADFNNNTDSFYGNYDYMVRQLMAWKPYAHIFCFTIPEIEGGTSANYNTAIKEICDLYPNKVHCINLAENYADYYDVDIVNDNYTGRHFNPVAYNYMSLIIEKAINEYMEENDDLFATAPYQ